MLDDVTCQQQMEDQVSSWSSMGCCPAGKDPRGSPVARLSPQAQYPQSFGVPVRVTQFPLHNFLKGPGRAFCSLPWFGLHTPFHRLGTNNTQFWSWGVRGEGTCRFRVC